MNNKPIALYFTYMARRSVMENLRGTGDKLGKYTYRYVYSPTNI